MVCYLQTSCRLRRPICINSWRKGDFSYKPRQYNSRKDSIHTVPGEKVHKDCRRKYCKPDQIAKDTKQEASTSSDRHVLRSSEEGFSFATDCFFCGGPAKFGRKRKKYDVLQVKTIGLKDTLLATYAANEPIVGQILSKHAFCMCMTCMQQMQFTTVTQSQELD